MNIRRILGLIIVIGGVSLLFFSNYIRGQTAEGREKISSAQKKVDQGSQLFSLSPVTKDLGQGLTNSAQKKINEGKEKVGYYEDLAEKCQVAGYILIAIGAVVILLPTKK